MLILHSSTLRTITLVVGGLLSVISIFAIVISIWSYPRPSYEVVPFLLVGISIFSFKKRMYFYDDYFEEQTSILFYYKKVSKYLYKSFSNITIELSAPNVLSGGGYSNQGDIYKVLFKNKGYEDDVDLAFYQPTSGRKKKHYLRHMEFVNAIRQATKLSVSYSSSFKNEMDKFNEKS
jgi:hypothetical protein